MILTLPHEIIMHVFGFVDDKTGLSMTCKLFDKLLLDMYRSGQISNINDSYFLKHQTDTYFTDGFVDLVVHKIHNHYCLNLIMTKSYSSSNTYIRILKQVLKINQITKPKLMCKTVKCIDYFATSSILLCETLNEALNHDAYDTLKMIFCMNFFTINCFLVK